MRILKSVNRDLSYIRYSYLWLYLLCGALVNVVIVAISSRSNAVATRENFTRSAERYEESGDSVVEALQSDLTVIVSPDSGVQEYDNPALFHYVDAVEAARATSGLGFVNAVLDLGTFIVLPIAIFYVGTTLATYEWRYGTMKLRYLSESRSMVLRSQALAIVVCSAALIVMVAVLSAVASLFLGGSGDLPYSSMADEIVPTNTGFLATAINLSISMLFVAFFGITAFGLAVVLRRGTVSLLLMMTYLLGLPFIGTFDPRSLMTVIASRSFTFGGQFELRPPIEMSSLVAGFCLLAYALMVITLSEIVASLRSSALTK